MKTFLSALTVLAASVAFAGGLTPETFIQADVEVREITLAGMQSQIELLAAGASAEALSDADESNRGAVEQAFLRYGTTGAAHAAYGTRFAQEISSWLEEHPDWLLRQGELTWLFEDLAVQLHQLRGGN